MRTPDSHRDLRPIAPRGSTPGTSPSSPVSPAPTGSPSAVSPASSASPTCFPSATSPTASASPPIRVMLIDDHPVVRAGLRAILDSFEDITVIAEGSDGTAVHQFIGETGESTGANSGENAGSATDGANVDVADVVVMDIQMDRMNGIEATRTLVAAGGPPVLILTTYDSEADIVDALSAGALGYLLKDAPEEELHQAVLATARGESTFSPHVGATLARRLGQPLVALSPRETEILRGLSTGATNQELASTLFISPATVKTHLMHIYQKLGVDNRTAAVHEARNRRLI